MSIRRWKYSEMIEWILCNMILRLQLWSSGGHQIMLSVCLCQMHLTSWCSRCSSQVRVWLGQVYVIVSPSSRFLYGQATSIPIKGVGIVKPQLRAAKTEECHRRCFNYYSQTHSGRVFGAHFLLRHSISKYGHFPLDHWKPFLQRYFVTSMPKTLSEPSPSGAGGGWSGQNISRGKLPVCYLLISSITRSSKDEKWPYTAHRAVVSSASSAKCIAYCTVQNST